MIVQIIKLCHPSLFVLPFFVFFMFACLFLFIFCLRCLLFFQRQTMSVNSSDDESQNKYTTQELIDMHSDVVKGPWTWYNHCVFCFCFWFSQQKKNKKKNKKKINKNRHTQAKYVAW